MTATQPATPVDAAPREATNAPPAAIDAYLIPNVGKGNRYQPLLAEGLEAAGIRVQLKQDLTPKLMKRIVERGARRPQIVHLHWQTYLTRPSLPGSIRASTSFLTRLVRLRRNGARLVWTVHHLIPDEHSHQAWERLTLTAQGRIVHQAIVHSRGAAEETVRFLRVPEEKLSIIPHGHYADAYPNTISREDARAQLGIAADKSVLLFFGRIRELKGVPELLDGFAQVSNTDAVLLIAGDPWTDPLRRLVEQRAAANPRIRIALGFIPEEDVQVYMNAADCVVLPFRSGITSGSLALSMSFGKAIVAANTPSLASVPPEGGAIFFDQKRPGALPAALEQAAGTDLRAMGERNQEHIMQWGWDRVGRLTRRVYEGECVRD